MDAKKVLEVLDTYDAKFLGVATVIGPNFKPERCDPQTKYQHITNEDWTKLRHTWWAVQQCREFVDAGRMEKAFRWLGFIQGAMWSAGIYSVEDMANHNKPVGEETDLDPSRVRRFWRIAGLDLFDGTFYDLDGEFATEESAQEAACKRYDELDKTQASAGDLQDRVYIVRPDKTKYRALKARTAR